MEIKWNLPKECCGCTACVNICPKQCIEMETDKEGFLYPVVDQQNCINCGRCKTVCPIDAKANETDILCAYAAMNYDPDTRLVSSSGGIFALLAEEIIAQNGVVFGAILTDDCKSVKHTIARNNHELRRMFGSKYMQSDLRGVYPQVKEALRNGKKVLFTGTPCQINGLRLFLGKEYENLLLVDIICHGVPSPALWSKYVASIEKKYHATVTDVNFRSKKNGWQDFGINRIDKQNRELFISKDQDPYMQMFLRNYCLRPSCYQCSAKEIRYSDITIGDFWGIENVMPEMNDGMGTSAIIVRTGKGEAFIKQVSTGMRMKKTDYKVIVQHNSAEIKPVYKPLQRESFFVDMNSKSFSALQRKYLKKSVKTKLRSVLIRFGIWKIIRPEIKRGG